MTLLRRNPRRDANEPAIVQYLQRAGCVVLRLSAPDAPDLLVGYRKRWLLLEVKVPNGKLKVGQELFHQACTTLGLPCHVVHSPEEARAVLKRV